jgi:hypothetical protein
MDERDYAERNRNVEKISKKFALNQRLFQEMSSNQFFGLALHSAPSLAKNNVIQRKGQNQISSSMNRRARRRIPRNFQKPGAIERGGACWRKAAAESGASGPNVAAPLDLAAFPR